MSTTTGLRNWKDTAGRAVERSSPYVKRGGKWFIVHVLTPLLFYFKEVVIAAAASVLTGCQNLWAIVIQPFLNWLVESVFRVLRWVAEETAAGLCWVWNRLTPWSSRGRSASFVRPSDDQRLPPLEGVIELLSHRDDCASQIGSAFRVGEYDDEARLSARNTRTRAWTRPRSRSVSRAFSDTIHINSLTIVTRGMPEKTLFESERDMDTTDVAQYLRTVAEHLESGDEFTLESGNESVTLAPPGHVEFEVEVERETSESGESPEIELEFELEWNEDATDTGDLTIE